MNMKKWKVYIQYHTMRLADSGSAERKFRQS